MPSETLRAGPYRIDPDTALIHGPHGQARLSALELRFLRYLVERRGVPVSTEELLREVWGYHPSVESKAVQLLVTRLRKKLQDPADSPRLVQTTPGGGYRVPFEGDRDALLAQVERLARAWDHDPEALRQLDARMPEIEAALAEDLPLPARAALERAVALWALERQPHRSARPLLELAEADLPVLTRVACALLAARLMAVMGLNRRAVELLEPWLARCPEGVEGQRLRCEVLLVLSNLARLRDAPAQAEAAAQAALALAEGLGDPVLRGRAMGGLAAAWSARDPRDPRAERWSADAVDILRAAKAEVLLASFESNHGVRLYNLGRLGPAAEVLGRAAAGSRRSGRALDAAFSEVILGAVRLSQGAPREALALVEGALAVFAAAADHTGEVRARVLEGRVRAVLGEVDRADATLERAAQLAAQLESPRTAAAALTVRAWCAAMADAPGRASALADEAGATLAALGRAPDPWLALWRSWWAGTPAPATPPDWRDASARADWAEAALSRALATHLGCVGAG